MALVASNYVEDARDLKLDKYHVRGPVGIRGYGIIFKDAKGRKKSKLKNYIISIGTTTNKLFFSFF